MFLCFKSRRLNRVRRKLEKSKEEVKHLKKVCTRLDNEKKELEQTIVELHTTINLQHNDQLCN